MKKNIMYLLILVILIFIMPAVLTKNKVEKETGDMLVEEISKEEVEEVIEPLENTSTDVIKLLKVNENKVEEINLNEYLYSVVSAEMPVDFHIEALKSQAIVARTYTLYKKAQNRHEEADICDQYTCCQAYITKEGRFERWEDDKEEKWEKIQNAVNSTTGQIITYEGSPIEAFFHSNSGGMTEIPVNVWGGGYYPYLETVATAGEENYDQYASKKILTKKEIEELLKDSYPKIEIGDSDDQIKILEFTDGQRAKTVRFGNVEIAGVEVRTIFGLKSTNFVIAKQDDVYTFYVTGYGHGVRNEPNRSRCTCK